jgi:pilus assembly protein CpaF
MAWIDINRKAKAKMSERQRNQGAAEDGNGENAEGRSGPGPAPASKRPKTEDWYLAIKRDIHQHIIATMNPAAIGTMSEDELRLEVRRQAEEICRRCANLLSAAERERLVDEVLDETFGLGPLEPLVQDPEVSDILINGPKTIYIERRGRLEKTSVAFHDERHVLQVVQRIVARTGRRVDETCPMVDARLPDGSRLNAIIRPLALDGPLVSIRRFGARPLLIQDLLANQSITEEMHRFLAACVTGRINILISGGTGSGCASGWKKNSAGGSRSGRAICWPTRNSTRWPTAWRRPAACCRGGRGL